MSKCPMCKEEIDFLSNTQTINKCWHVSLGKSGFLEYDEWGDEDVDDCGIYYCPKCHEELFHSEEDARKFLKGEDVNGKL